MLKVQEAKKKKIQTIITLMVFCSMLAVISAIFCEVPVYAAGEDLIKNSFTLIYNIIAAVVSSIGTILLLWGVFEWAQSLNTQDGAAQTMAFKRIGAGLVATLAPQLIPLLSAGINA